jgi:hypothetical protein
MWINKEEYYYVGALAPWELNDNNNCKLFRKRYYNE